MHAGIVFLALLGQGQIPGRHTARITGDGLQVFPRLLKPEERPACPAGTGAARLATGVPGLDETLMALRESVLRIGATRAVIDSLSGPILRSTASSGARSRW